MSDTPSAEESTRLPTLREAMADLKLQMDPHLRRSTVTELETGMQVRLGGQVCAVRIKTQWGPPK